MWSSKPTKIDRSIPKNKQKPPNPPTAAKITHILEEVQECGLHYHTNKLEEHCRIKCMQDTQSIEGDLWKTVKNAILEAVQLAENNQYSTHNDARQQRNNLPVPPAESEANKPPNPCYRVARPSHPLGWFLKIGHSATTSARRMSMKQKGLTEVRSYASQWPLHSRIQPDPTTESDHDWTMIDWDFVAQLHSILQTKCAGWVL